VAAAAREAMRSQSAPPTTTATQQSDRPTVASPPTSSRNRERQDHRWSRRQQRFEQVLELHRQGLSDRAIGRRLQIHRDTVSRYLKAGVFRERAEPHSTRRTNRFANYLRQRWAEGCRNAAQLFEELKGQGFGGSYHAVRRHVLQWRLATPPKEADRATAATRLFKRPSARRVSWLREPVTPSASSADGLLTSPSR
jgi:DNA-binding CsgD family transcriptional regulator